MQKLFLLFILFVFSSCVAEIKPDIIFEEISQPYIVQYGQPQKIIEYQNYIVYYWDHHYTIFHNLNAEGDWAITVDHEISITLSTILESYLLNYGEPGYYEETLFYKAIKIKIIWFVPNPDVILNLELNMVSNQEWQIFE